MAVVTLLALFGSNEDLFDFLDPIGGRLSIGLLRNGPFMKESRDGERQQDEDSDH